MSKAFWIAQSKVIEPASYGTAAKMASDAAARLGGVRILARGGSYQQLEGAASFNRYVLLEFSDFDAAVRFHGSPEYQASAAIRLATGNMTQVAVVAGVDGT